MAAGQTHQRPLVFISYSRIDSEFADRLRADLKASGFDPWIDATELADQGGQSWLRLIQDAVDSSQAMVLILSPDALQSDYVHMEYHRVQTQKKTLIPLHYRTVTDVPIDLALTHWLEFRADHGGLDWYQTGFSYLIRSLTKALQLKELALPSQPPTSVAPIILPNSNLAEPAPQASIRADDNRQEKWQRSDSIGRSLIRRLQNMISTRRHLAATDKKLVVTQQEREAFLRGWRAATDEVLSVLASEARDWGEEEAVALATDSYKLPASFALDQAQGSFRARLDLLTWLTQLGPAAQYGNAPELARALDALIDGNAGEVDLKMLGLNPAIETSHEGEP